MSEADKVVLGVLFGLLSLVVGSTGGKARGIVVVGQSTVFAGACWKVGLSMAMLV